MAGHWVLKSLCQGMTTVTSSYCYILFQCTLQPLCVSIMEAHCVMCNVHVICLCNVHANSPFLRLTSYHIHLKYILVDFLKLHGCDAGIALKVVGDPTWWAGVAAAFPAVYWLWCRGETLSASKLTEFSWIVKYVSAADGGGWAAGPG